MNHIAPHGVHKGTNYNMKHSSHPWEGLFLLIFIGSYKSFKNQKIKKVIGFIALNGKYKINKNVCLHKQNYNPKKGIQPKFYTFVQKNKLC